MCLHFKAAEISKKKIVALADMPAEIGTQSMCVLVEHKLIGKTIDIMDVTKLLPLLMVAVVGRSPGTRLAAKERF